MSAWLRRREFLLSAVGSGAWGLVRPNANAFSFPADGVVNLRDHGAIGDGVTDDGPALQAALDTLTATGGGTLIVSPGRYALRSPVAKDFFGAASAIVVEGAGSSSQFLVQTGAGAAAITLQNLDSILFDDVTFVGTPGVGTDALTTLLLAACAQATLRRTDFYGVSSMVSGGGVVTAIDTDLRIDSSAFRGCGGHSGIGAAVVQNESWRALSVTDTDFVDWGFLNGVYHSKTPIAPPLAWIRLGNAVPTSPTSPQGFDVRSHVTIERVRMDEGAYMGFACLPNAAISRRIASILVSGLRVNVAGFDGGRGCHIQWVDNLRIEHSWFGYATRPRDAIKLRQIGEAVLDGVLCQAGATTITADNEVMSLHVRESQYGQILSESPLTRVTRGGIEATLLKADGPFAARSLVVQSPASDRRVVIAPVGAPVSAIVGVALDEARNVGDPVRVVRLGGVAVTLSSDGTTAISRGNAVGPSLIYPGRVRAITSGDQIGRSLNSVPAAVWATPQVQLFPGRV